jgi:hypothetical protein
MNHIEIQEIIENMSEETRSINITKSEIIALIRKTHIPYSKMDLVKGWIKCDSGFADFTWDSDKLNKLDFDKLEILFSTVRKDEWQKN